MTTQETTPTLTDAERIEARIFDLLATSGHLIEVLEEENKALREHDAGRVTSLLEAKTKLAGAYENEINGFKQEEVSLDDLDEELVERLRLQGEKVTALIEENALRLASAIEARKRLMEAIAASVKSAASNKAVGYSTNGSYASPGRGASARNVSVSLNTTF